MAIFVVLESLVVGGVVVEVPGVATTGLMGRRYVTNQLPVRRKRIEEGLTQRQQQPR